jgi:hypothetical protein
MKSMRNLFGGLFAMLAALFLSGCFQAEQVINVKPDGSGTVVLTIKMTKESLAQMKALGGGAADADPLADMLKQEEAEQIAAKLGEGVKVVKVEPYAEGNFQGKRATFSFTDINKVKADLSMGPDVGGDDDKEPVKFVFTKGSPAKLIIHSPGKKPQDKPEDPQEEAQMAAAAPMMKDMRLTLAVNVEGTIVKTDAENREGSKIILVDLPVGEALKDIKKFKAIDKAPDWTSAAKLMKEIPGAKVESKTTVNVELQ